MIKLLILADDFTGALDTGVQFAARGAKTRVVTDVEYDFSGKALSTQVLVVDAETRHLSAQEAYDVIYKVVCAAKRAGFTHIYKKTDSALRGNVGSELLAAMRAAGEDRLHFIPAFPKLNRVTRGGIHYINDVPVAQSVFGLDPFEPVRFSDIKDILNKDIPVPVVLRAANDRSGGGPGVNAYDAADEQDMREIASRLGQEGLRLCAGCAGFACALADELGICGVAPISPKLEPRLFMVCGSVNAVTVRQMQAAQRAGYPRIHLDAVQKLDALWLDSVECEAKVKEWIALSERSGCCILDVNDPEGSNETGEYAKAHGLCTEQMRVMISGALGRIMKRLFDGGLKATLLCTGGDTLLALMKAVGVSELIPVCEPVTGAVLTSFDYQGASYNIISKSGGFGEPELVCALTELVCAEKEKEEVS